MADTWQPHFIIVTDPMDTFVNNIWIPSERTIEMIPFGEIQLEEGKITKIIRPWPANKTITSQPKPKRGRKPRTTKEQIQPEETKQP